MSTVTAPAPAPSTDADPAPAAADATSPPLPLGRAVLGVARELAAAARWLPEARAVAPFGPRPRGVEVEVVTDLVRLAAHGAAWDAIVAASSTYRPQAAHAYVAAYLRHLRAPAARWACAIATRGGELVAALPFLIAPAHGGVHLDAASLDGDLVVRDGADDAVPAILAALDRAAPRWVTLGLGELEDGSPTVARLAGGPAVLRDVIGHASFLRLPRSYDAYLAGLSSTFRGNLRRLTRKVLALPGASVEIVAARDARPEHLDALIAVEASGWKAREGNAIARRGELAAYYRDITDGLAAAGALQWAILRAEGRPLAVFFGIRLGRRLALDKIAYDEGRADLAPGNVLLGRVIEHAIASGEVDELDFLSDAPWNRRWHADRRASVDLTIHRPRAWALATAYAPALARRRLRDQPLVRRAAAVLARRRGAATASAGAAAATSPGAGPGGEDAS